MKNDLLNSIEKLRSVLSYNKHTGDFTWIGKTGPRVNIVLGSKAGTVGAWGRLIISAFGVHYFASRLAWAFTHNAWPVGEVDHRDGDPLNNRISNLRDVTRVVNQQNLRTRKAGCKHDLPQGVSIGHNLLNPYIAQLRSGGKTLHLGYFNDPAVAHQAYLTAKREHHEGCTI